jgi:hypothetical protein
MKISFNFESTVYREIGFYQFTFLPSLIFVKTIDSNENPYYIFSLCFLNYEVSIHFENK